MRVALVAALAVLLFGSALSAGTVTLTGACKNTLQAGNTLAFSLSNSGNDTAYNLILTPRTIGAVPQASTFNLASLGPGSNYSLSIPLENISMRGSFVDAVLVSYQQGSLFVTDIFPCYVTMGNVSASSDIYLSASSSSKNDVATIRVSAYNAGRMPLDANISLMLPPTFKFITSASFTAELAPYSSKNVTFEVQPQSSAVTSAGGAVAASYLVKGVYYSSIALIAVKSSSSNGPGIIVYALFASVAAIIAIIAVLILRIEIKRRKSSTKPDKASL